MSVALRSQDENKFIHSLNELALVVPPMTTFTSVEVLAGSYRPGSCWQVYGAFH